MLRSTVPLPPRRKLKDRLSAPPALGALAVGYVFWLASLRPTLLPRPAVMQGALSALCLNVGYGVGGVLVGWGVWLGRRNGWSGPSAQLRRAARRALLVLGAVGVVAGVPMWLAWQNQQRELVNLPTVGVGAVVTMLVVTVLAGLVLFFVFGRLFAAMWSRVDVGLSSLWNPVAARLMGGAMLVLFFAIVFNTVVVDGVLSRLEASYAEGDNTTAAGVEQPTSTHVTGGPGSLAPWDTLGLEGRTWVGGTSTVEQLQAFAGPGVTVTEPVRAYAGLQSEPDVDRRAQLAVAELERAGGFDRKVLVVATATGSGFVNAVMSSALEYQWAGDSAIVSMQYSYLPSWIAFLVGRDKAIEAGTALNTAVLEKWSTLPRATRPRLVVFGESLGSMGSEPTFRRSTAQASVDDATERADSVLWVGPTNNNEVWSQVVGDRTPGSPVWKAEFGDGRQVSFATSLDEIPPQRDGVSRIQYLQHASDPVGWWNWYIAWRPPEWVTDRPHGPDVPQRPVGWFPFVTWICTSADLIQGFGAPAGHGHNYNDAWAQALAGVSAPPGWTDAQTEQLQRAMLQLHGLGGN
ncbi:MAG: alpha/beta-hydrolase family protein [Actinomycetes bacterium]